MLGLVFVNASSRASRSAGVYLERREDIRDEHCDAASYIGVREMVRGDGILRFGLRLAGREFPGRFSGKISIPGSGGNGLFMSTLKDVVLLKALSVCELLRERGTPSKTPAAVGDMTEKAILLLRPWNGFFTAVSSNKLDIDERPLYFDDLSS